MGTINYKTKIFSISIVSFLLSSLFIIHNNQNVSAWTDGVLHEFDVSINGYQCLSNREQCRSAGASINESNNTVTLRNANISNLHIKIDNTNSKIYLKGNNTVDMDGVNYGFRFQKIWETASNPTTPGTVTITGDEGATLNIKGNSKNGKNLFGILSKGNIIIDSKVRINIILTDTLPGENTSIYGFYTEQTLTNNGNNNIRIAILTDNTNDESNYYGIQANNLSFTSNGSYELDLADHSGKSFPLSTEEIQTAITNSIASISESNLILSARDKENKQFSGWQKKGLDTVLEDISPVTIPLSSLTTNSSITAIYEDIEPEPEPESEPTEYEILSTGVEDEYNPEDETTFRNYIETDEIANNHSFIIRIDASPSNFLSIKLDEATLTNENYIIEDGDMIVKLKPSLLSSLEAGGHSIVATFDDGYANNTFFVIESEPEPEPEPIEYKILSMGVEGEYDLGDETTFRNYIETDEIADNRSFLIRIDANPSNFLLLELNDNPVPKEYYNVENGSTIIRLNPSLLSGLDNNEYKIIAIFNDGYSLGTFSILQSEPQAEPESETSDKETAPKTPETGANMFETSSSANSIISTLVISFGISIILVRLRIKQ